MGSTLDVTWLDFVLWTFRVDLVSQFLDVEDAVSAVQILGDEVNRGAFGAKFKIFRAQRLHVLQVGEVNFDKLVRLVPRWKNISPFKYSYILRWQNALKAFFEFLSTALAVLIL